MEKLHEVAEIQVSCTPTKLVKQQIKSSNDAYKILKELYPLETINLKEQFIVLYLNNANKVIGSYKLSEGGLTATVADVRILLGVALKLAAKSIVVSHNHPSGNLFPSSQDKELTKKLKSGCAFLDISLVDHLIISGENGFYSFADEGEL